MALPCVSKLAKTKVIHTVFILFLFIVILLFFVYCTVYTVFGRKSEFKKNSI
jgi:hypothetical protein